MRPNNLHDFLIGTHLSEKQQKAGDFICGFKLLKQMKEKKGRKGNMRIFKSLKFFMKAKGRRYVNINLL